MNPQEPPFSNAPNQQPVVSPPPTYGAPEPPKRGMRKGLKITLIVIGVIVLLLAILRVRAVMIQSSKEKNADKSMTNQPKIEGQVASTGPKVFTVSYAKDAPTYAGSKVYDACSLFTFQAMASKIGGLPELNDANLLTEPLSIEHGYIDRSISAVLGSDGQPRSITKTITSEGAKATSLDNFASIANSYCVYGQNLPSSTTFARLYVTQPPTPLTPEFLPFLANLPKKQVNGVDVYSIDTPNEQGFKFAAMVRPDKKVAVILKSGDSEVISLGIDEITKKMTADPTGSPKYQYPGMYGKLIDSCSLFSATDFEKFMGKKASATVTESLLVTKGLELGVDRNCRRHQVDSQREPAYESDSVDITIRQGKSDTAAKSWLESKKGSIYIFTPSQTKLGDESFIRVNEGDDANSRRSYKLFVRISAAVIEIDIDQSAAGDASATAFEQRIMPAAKIIVDNYKKRVK
jgi:hypothetical protein